MININSLYVGYNNKAVVSDVNLQINSGTITSIIGPNGCGKSTLMKCIARQLHSLKGSVQLMGVDINLYSPREFAKHVSFLKQHRDIPLISVQNLVLHGRFPYMTFPRKITKDDMAIAVTSMEKVGVYHLKDKMLSNLSGGERQKVYIAMALTQNCSVLLLDEPTTYLDISHQIEFMNILLKLKESGKTVLTILHDINSALQISDNICVIDNGKVEFMGSPNDLLISQKIDKIFSISTRTVDIEGKKYLVFLR